MIFCEICDDSGKNFKTGNNDISVITQDQIIKELPVPNLNMTGQRISYALNKSSNVYVQGCENNTTNFSCSVVLF